jgi:hypothetical protein
MECNMKQFPDPDIVEQIVTALGPLRDSVGVGAQAHTNVESALELLRNVPSKKYVFDRHWYFRDGPDAASIRKAARNLHKALKAFSGEKLIMLGGDRTMHLHEFRCALDWLGPKRPTFGTPKRLAALYAYSLVNQYSQKPPSGTSSGQVREIGTLLYQAISGEEADLKRQTDTVILEVRRQEKLAELFAASRASSRRNF